MQQNTQIEKKKKIDWRITIGTVISIFWLLVLTLYLAQQVSWQQFLSLPLDEIGSFLGGAFSPLAFLWLVIGFFVQQEEIQENSRNIETQAQHTNLDNFLKMAEIIYVHLGMVTGYLFVSCIEEMQEASDEIINVEDLWARSGTVDLGIFARRLNIYQYDDNNPRDMTKIFYGTPVRRRHSDNYKKIFGDLLENARLCDATGGLLDALVDGTVWGILYKLIVEVESQNECEKQRKGLPLNA